MAYVPTSSTRTPLIGPVTYASVYSPATNPSDCETSIA